MISNALLAGGVVIIWSGSWHSWFELFWPVTYCASWSVSLGGVTASLGHCFVRAVLIRAWNVLFCFYQCPLGIANTNSCIPLQVVHGVGIVRSWTSGAQSELGLQLDLVKLDSN